MWISIRNTFKQKQTQKPFGSAPVGVPIGSMDASKILHQISWPILKENKDICNNKDSYSLGILFATEKDLPERDSALFRVLFNENINTYYLKKFNAMSFPIVISVAKNSPAYKATLNENDVILEINEQNVSNFRKKLKES